MKKSLIIILVFISFLVCGCAADNAKISKFNLRINEYSQDYLMNNDIALLTSSIYKDEEVISFSKQSEFGIASFYMENGTEEIKYKISEKAKTDNENKIFYTQVEGKNRYFIGIFIDDKVLVSKTVSIKIIYENGLVNKLKGIEPSNDDLNDEILSYEDDEMRNVKSIKLFDINENEIYKMGR